jgi:hypothetical protein
VRPVNQKLWFWLMILLLLMIAVYVVALAVFAKTLVPQRLLALFICCSWHRHLDPVATKD